MNVPFPHEHAARLQNPSKYSTCRRSNDKFGSGIHGIFCQRKDDQKWELQSLRFDVAKFTAAEAKAWLKEHGFVFILFEPALD